jgi:signal transduction histidine kinase
VPRAAGCFGGLRLASNSSNHPTFSVDTHLFRELGELLVGRDSTALIELVKNSYDADATEVVVYGEALGDPEHGRIVITDNGTGMGRAEFEQGFLRIASRGKDIGDRRSAMLSRRFTGAKGIGRLAAHKLARTLEVNSLRWDSRKGRKLQAVSGVEAIIEWDVVERYATLAELEGTNAISLREFGPVPGAVPGTTITLRHLRRAWTKASHGRFLEEVQTFGAGGVLSAPLPKSVIGQRLLFDSPIVRDSSEESEEPFRVRLEGDLQPPDNFWEAKVDAASWVIEIDAQSTRSRVKYGIAPTRSTTENLPAAERHVLSVNHPSPAEGPFFQARILLRTGKAWGGHANGVRVFLEGFRILPYGESGNDWLGLDRDVNERTRLLSLKPEDPVGELLPPSKGEGLLLLPNKHFFGAVFLTQESGHALRLLVNREGFVPDSAYETLVTVVRNGIELATRARAAASEEQRRDRRTQRRKRSATPEEVPAAAILRDSLTEALGAAKEARRLIGVGDTKGAQARVSDTLKFLDGIDTASGELISEVGMLRVLASVGTQMAAFIHEIHGLIGTAESVDQALRHLKDAKQIPAREQRQSLNTLARIVSDLKRSLERQASYLTDVVSADARRRRRRLSLAERFDAATQLVAVSAASKGIRIENNIPVDVMAPPMFPAELTTIFSNLLTNAVKAAGENGAIRATARRRQDEVVVRVENTGVRVDPGKGERWFRPFESSSAQVDAALGRSMGLGLPITRSVLAEYGASIAFAAPSASFSTALEIVLRVK